MDKKIPLKIVNLLLALVIIKVTKYQNVIKLVVESYELIQQLVFKEILCRFSFHL